MFARVFYLVMSTKWWAGFFLFCLDLDLLMKVKKNECLETRSFFANNSTSKQNKKNPIHTFVDISK